MPVCKEPEQSDFRIYTTSANGYVFYVGMGREARATDRVRWTKYCVRREAAGQEAKWSMNTRVIARLLKRGIEPELKFVTCKMPRQEALRREKKLIRKLYAEGAVLANRTHNDGQAGITVERVVRAIYAAGRAS